MLEGFDRAHCYNQDVTVSSQDRTMHNDDGSRHFQDTGVNSSASSTTKNHQDGPDNTPGPE
jgi:hypothetical protein